MALLRQVCSYTINRIRRSGTRRDITRSISKGNMANTSFEPIKAQLRNWHLALPQNGFYIQLRLPVQLQQPMVPVTMVFCSWAADTALYHQDGVGMSGRLLQN